MRKLTAIALTCLTLCAYVYAGGDTVVVEGTSATTAKTNTSSKARGLLDAIVIDVVAGSTQTVNIATGDETVFNLAGITADAVYRPRVAAHTTAGVAIASTNNILERIYLSSEKLTVIVTATQTVTNDVSVKLKWIDK